MYFNVGSQFTFALLKFISDTKWLSLITETDLEGLDAHTREHPHLHGNDVVHELPHLGTLLRLDGDGSKAHGLDLYPTGLDLDSAIFYFL
jgi:hypothetical protein